MVLKELYLLGIQYNLGELCLFPFIGIQILFNLVIPDHDAKVFNPPNVHRQLPLDYYTEVLIEGFRRWDGIYFHHIAEHGYTYENTLVFFPLFPLSVRILANSLLYPLQYLVSYGNTLTFAAFLVNLVIFVKSAKILYQLSLHILGDEKLAFKAIQLYCINPASIFFSACYSETLFAYLTFKGMLSLEKGRPLTGSFLFGFSALTRSNGLVNAGFVLHKKLLESVRTVSAHFVEKKKTNSFTAAFTSMCLLLGNFILQIILCVLPFIAFQYYAYTVFCNRDATYRDLKSHILNYGNKQGYKMPHTGLSRWCGDWLPYSYAYVQAKHWDVGFMSYWHFKQIPNFILATPIVLLSVAAILNYIYNNMAVCLTLGMKTQTKQDIAAYKKTDIVESPTSRVGFHQRELFVYVAELTFLLLFGMFFMHIQVLTRFLCSSSPVLYWFIAYTTTPLDKLPPPQYNSKQDTRSSHHLKKQSTKTQTTTANDGSSSLEQPENHTKTDESSLDAWSSHHLKEQSTKTKTTTDNDGSSSLEQPENHTETDESSPQGLQDYHQGGDSEVFAPGDLGGMQNDLTRDTDFSSDLSLTDFDDMYDWDSNNWLHRAIFIYMHLYFFVGIAAFSNFLPWT